MSPGGQASRRLGHSRPAGSAWPSLFGAAVRRALGRAFPGCSKGPPPPLHVRSRVGDPPTGTAMRPRPAGLQGGCGVNPSLCQHSSASSQPGGGPPAQAGMTTPGKMSAGREAAGGVTAETFQGRNCTRSPGSVLPKDLRPPLPSTDSLAPGGRRARAQRGQGRQGEPPGVPGPGHETSRVRKPGCVCLDSGPHGRAHQSRLPGSTATTQKSVWAPEGSLVPGKYAGLAPPAGSTAKTPPQRAGGKSPHSCREGVPEVWARPAALWSRGLYSRSPASPAVFPTSSLSPTRSSPVLGFLLHPGHPQTLPPPGMHPQTGPLSDHPFWIKDN